MGQRLQRVLGRSIRPHKRVHRVAADRAEIDDAPGRERWVLARAQERQECLGHRHDAKDVHLELPAQLIHGKVHQRPADGNPCIVDQPEETLIPYPGGDHLRRLLYCVRVGHVHQQRRQPCAQFRFHARGVFLPADGPEYMTSVLDQVRRGRVSDTG